MVDPHAPPLRGSLPLEEAGSALGRPCGWSDCSQASHLRRPGTPPLRGSLPSEGADVAGDGSVPHRSRAARTLGFTLIELLVAIAILSLLALLSWRSLDGMTRTQTLTHERADELIRFQSSIAQWQADLDAMVDTGEISPLAFDGRLLRMTRRDAAEAGLDSAGIRVVAWTRFQGALPPREDGNNVPGLATASGYWVRWQSQPLVRRDELARAWQRAAEWSREARPITGDTPGSDSAIALIGIDQWQLFYNRGDGWSNPQSSVGTKGPDDGRSNASELPEGVRLILTLAPGQRMAGNLVRDWVRPTMRAGRE
jgi:general secretion pathway protein J